MTQVSFNKVKMSVIALTFMFFMMNSFVYAQKIKTTDVPEVVQEALLREHPMAKLKEWMIEEKMYIAIVVEDGVKGKVYIQSDGEWEISKFEAPIREMPAKISEYIKTNYPNFIISESSYAQNKTDKTFYYLEVKRTGIGAGLPSKLKFTTAGDLINREDPPGFTVQETATQNEVQKNKRVATNPDAVPKEEKTKKPEKKLPDYLISESSVPGPVMKTFNKRFMKAEKVQWFHKEEDSLYTAKCVFREINNQVIISASGAWVETRTEMSEETLFASVKKYLDVNFKGHKLVYADKIMRADKSNGYSAIIYEKANLKDKLETKLVFDKSGKILKTYYPNITDAGTTPKESSLDRKFSNSYETDQENLKDGEEKMKNQEVKEKELPSPINRYIATNYPGFRTKKCYFIEDADLGNVYQIKVQRDGINQPSVELFFDKFGNFIRSEDDKGVEKTAEPVVTETVVETVSEVTPPDAVKTAFTAKFPKITSVRWEEENDGFLGSFDDKKGIQKVMFMPDGTWEYSANQMNSESLSDIIKDHIKKNHGKKVQITKAWIVKKKDKKTYYKVEILDPKTKSENVLEYTNSGKPVE